MKQKLLLLISSMLLFTVALQAQIQVWDFGAEQLDVASYTNMLDVTSMNAVINANAGTVTPNAQDTNNVIDSPGLDFGDVKFITNSDNDRLRTSNTSITSRDDNVSGNDTEFTGRIYVNSGGNSDRFLQFELTAGDEITIIAKTDSGGNFNFEFITDPGLQQDIVSNDGSQVELHFTASQTGSYKIYDTSGKPSYYRVYFGNVSTVLDVEDVVSTVSTNIKAIGSDIYVSNVKSKSEINIYSITGALVKSIKTSEDINFTFRKGLYIATVKTFEGQKSVKLLTR